ncbi:MAG: DNA-binding protein [Rhodocyclales bacterium GWA2_65_19]|nr:MAG: DNA-binding protein [Rhodocyclales bacterium GWA2_65_19]
MSSPVVAVDTLSGRIHLVRGQRVMLDADLAELYGVATKVFNQAIKRNIDRFPADFMFQLTVEEHDSLRSQTVTLDADEPLRSQIVTSKTGRGRHRKYLPYVFTEHGAIMAASVLNAPRAVEMSVFVVRAFVQLRELLASSQELADRLDDLERKLSTHDQAIAGVIDAIRRLTSVPAKPSRPIGFTADLKDRKP